MDNFVNEWIGQGLDTDNFPPDQPFQCYDVFIAYIRILSKNPNLYFIASQTGYAEDIYTLYDSSPLLQSLFDKFPFEATGQKGDVVVWGKSPATPYSHVALLEKDNGTTQHIFGQNQPYPYCTERDLTSKGLLGYLRPKTNQIQGDTNVAIIENVDNWRGRASRSFEMIRGREMTTGEFEPWIGQDFLHLIEALEDNPEADAQVKYANLGRQATTEDWAKKITDLQNEVNGDTILISDLKTKLAQVGVPVTPPELSPVISDVPTVPPFLPTPPVAETTKFGSQSIIDFLVYIVKNVIAGVK